MSQFVDKFVEFGERYLSWVSVPKIMWTDVVEVLLIAYLLYHLLVWARNTKAWSLAKGIIVILLFVLLATIFNMSTILWIVKNVISVALMALVVVFQPELRKALEKLGQKNVLSAFFSFDNKITDELFSDETIDELIRASYEMGKAKTGALMVIQKTESLSDYEKTGIMVDGILTSQLLINIFEHNTPLHDGAVIINGDRITAATCYLPLSDNRELSKDLGTRHRAGVGISEVTDSFTIIVSEETGRVSIAKEGRLYPNVNKEFLRKKLEELQNKTVEEKKFRLWKGRSRNEEDTDK